MTGAEFKQWRKDMHFTQRQAAEILDLSTSTIEQYESGFKKGTHEPCSIPRVVAFACVAILYNITP